LVVGERGHQPSATVWSLATGAVVRELAGGHRFGIGCVAFTPSGGGVVTMGFKHDRMLRIWDLRLADGATVEPSQDNSPDRSALSDSGYPSSDPDSPPPPPPPPYPPDDTQTADAPGLATAAATASREKFARQVASARIPQRVRSMTFTSDGECLVTCGDGHVKFWKMPAEGGHARSERGGGRREGARRGLLGIGADVLPPDPSTGVATNSGVSPRSAKAGVGRRVRGGQTDEVREAAGVDSPASCVLEGWTAILLDEFKEAIFLDVSSSCEIGVSEGVGGRGGGGAGTACGRAAGLESVFCVTSEGILCAFTRGGVMEHWVSLEAPAAYGLSVHENGTLAAACADGLVRLFEAESLLYVATLPRPPPLGCANIASVRELQAIADLSAAAATKVSAAVPGGGDGVTGAAAAGAHLTTTAPGSGLHDGVVASPEDSDDVNVGTIGKDALDQRLASQGDEGGRRCGVGDVASCESGVAIRYPAALGCRLSPCGTKVVCIYADRGFFIWDVKDPLCVGKYRSFLAHGGCIWDVQRMPEPSPAGKAAHNSNPSPLPDIPAGAMVTCSADNTVRLWDLGALDGKSSGDSTETSHSGRWSNIYSKHLLRVLYGDREDAAAGVGGNTPPGKVAGEGRARCRSDDVGRNTGGETNVAESAAEETALSEGGFDPEVPHKPEWSCAPRSLAVHPDGSQVACGDKGGHIRVYDLTEMELAHTQSAHDAEVLCLAYSPVMIPAGGGGVGGTKAPLPHTPNRSGGGLNASNDGEKGSVIGIGAADGGTGDTKISPPPRPPPSPAAATAVGQDLVSMWEAVDSLGPAGAAEKMTLLALGSAAVAPKINRTAVESVRDGESSLGGRGDEPCTLDKADGKGSQGGEGRSSGRDEQRAGESGKGGAARGKAEAGVGQVRPEARVGAQQNGEGCDRCPLVLLASASRDRLVHVFDASRHPRPLDGGGQSGVGMVAAATKTASESGGVDDGGGGGDREREVVGMEDERRGISSDLRAKGGDADSVAKKVTTVAAGSWAGGRTEVKTTGYPLLKTLDSHTGSVTAVKFSKDGKRLITAGGDKLLVLNTVRGPHVHRQASKYAAIPLGTIFGLDVDPTNKYIVTAGQ
ncbi:unnamed protein product, partial [Hapterophycus canaliculatus]